MKKIGEILIENGSITSTQLNEALQMQKKMSGKLIGQVLIEMGYVTEEDIVIALASQFNVPYLPITNFALSKSNAQIIPQELIQKYLCIPLDKMGNLLTVVISDPTNEEAIKAIEQATHCKIQMFVATSTEIITAIQQHLHLNMSKSDTEEVSAASHSNMAPKTAH